MEISNISTPQQASCLILWKLDWRKNLSQNKDLTWYWRQSTLTLKNTWPPLFLAGKALYVVIKVNKHVNFGLKSARPPFFVVEKALDRLCLWLKKHKKEEHMWFQKHKRTVCVLGCESTLPPMFVVEKTQDEPPLFVVEKALDHLCLCIWKDPEVEKAQLDHNCVCGCALAQWLTPPPGRFCLLLAFNLQKPVINNLHCPPPHKTLWVSTRTIQKEHAIMRADNTNLGD